MQTVAGWDFFLFVLFSVIDRFNQVKCPGLFTRMRCVRPKPVRVKRDARQGGLKGSPAQTQALMTRVDMRVSSARLSSLWF